MCKQNTQVDETAQKSTVSKSQQIFNTATATTATATADRPVVAKEKQTYTF